MNDSRNPTAGSRAGPALAWVHVGPPDGVHTNMLRLSLVSAQIFHPDLPKICVVPRAAADQMRQRLADLADSHGCEAAVHAADVPEGDDRERSRWLKICLARVLDRDVLCVDCDTLVVGPLDFRDVPDSALAAAVNQDGRHGVRFSSAAWVGERFRACGWDWEASSLDRYLNTGVVFYRTGREAEHFSERWLANWRHFRTRTGEHYDQLAFNRTAFETGLVGTLPPAWNAPVGVLPQTSRNARIFHYYSSQDDLKPHTLWGRLIGHDRGGRLPPPGILRTMLESRKPYVAVGAYPREYRLARQWSLFPAAWLQWTSRAVWAKVSAAFRPQAGAVSGAGDGPP